jgi:methyl-accepting chemotaxis protein
MLAWLLARLRIGPQLLLAPVLVLALLIAASGLGYWAMERQYQLLTMIVEVRAARIAQAGALEAEARAAHASSYQLLTWLGASVAPARVAALEAAIVRRHGTLAQRLARLGLAGAAGSTGKAEAALLRQAGAAHRQYTGAVREVIELAASDQSLAAVAMVKAEHGFARLMLCLDTLARHEQGRSQAALRQAGGDFALMEVLMPAWVVLSIVFSLTVTLAVRRSLLREVASIDQAARDLASGKLTVRARPYGSDEIADTSRTLDASIRSLSGTLADISASARSIDSASRLIALGSADLSDCADQQASSVGQTSASMEQLGATLLQNGEHARAAKLMAARATGMARAGGALVARLAQIMDTLGQGALPARAGLIENAGKLAAQAGGQMEAIAGEVRRIDALVGQISAASAAQASGLSDVSCAIVQMDHMTQHNCALVDAAAAAAARLQWQAGSLSHAVAAFRLDEAEPVASREPGVPMAGLKARPKLWLAARREE